MKDKKTWIIPTVELLSRGYIEGGNNPNVHENTGHGSGHDPNDHAAGPPNEIFFSVASHKSVPNFNQASIS